MTVPNELVFSQANPFAAYEIAEHLRDCILPYLAGTSAGLPDRRCIVSGEIAWDDCECGQLAIAIETGFPSRDFPDPADFRTGTAQGPGTVGNRICSIPMWVWTFRVSMLRCAPVTDDDRPPPCSDIDAAARVSVEDAWAIRAGVDCCLKEAIKRIDGRRPLIDYLVGTQLFVGSEGMCQGSELPVTVAMKNACYPCDVS